MSVVVRPSKEEDTAGRAALWRESGRFFISINPDTAQEADLVGLVDWVQELHTKVADDPAVLTLVADAHGEIVSALLARLALPAPSASRQVQNDFGRRRVHIDALTVAGSRRRLGVGTALMSAVEQWAAEQGAEVITLETGIDNPTSMPFCEHKMEHTPAAVTFRKALRRGPA